MKPNRKIFFIISCFLLLCFSKSHAAVYYITSTDSAGGLQLNNAIIQANADSLKDTIYFNIPGAGPFNVTLIYPIPAITKPLLIDGLSQPGNDTILWLTRLTGNTIGFEVSSSYCTMRGLRMIYTGINNDVAITIQLTTGILDSLKFEQNFIENYGGAIEVRNTPTGVGLALDHLTIQDNKFINNSPHGLELLPTPSSRYMKHLKLLRNTFINSPCLVVGTKPNRKAFYTIADNFFQNSDLELDDHQAIVKVLRNQFFDQSKLFSYSLSLDSLIISDNYFDSTAVDVRVDIEGTKNQKLYFERNNFLQNNSPGLQIRMIGVSNDSFAIDGIFIRDNYFNHNNFQSIVLESIGGHGTFKNINIKNNNLESSQGIWFFIISGKGSFTNCEISDNNINLNQIPPTLTPLIVVQLTAGSSPTTDSIIIRNDTLNGGGILFSQSGGVANFGNMNQKNIFIQNNVIKNAIEEGISLEPRFGDINNVYISNNDISFCKTGITLRVAPQSQYNDTVGIRQVIISNNQIYQNDSCGIIILNYPTNSNTVIDSVNIFQNNIYSNLYDGIRICNVMDDSSLINITSHMNISEDTITGNSGHGISCIDYGANYNWLSSPDFHHLTYSQNSIYNNGLLGINIENSNDPLIPLTPIFPFPVLTNLTTGAGSFTINGYLQADTNQSYTLEFFQNTLPDSSGSGEGETYIGSLNVTTNATGFVLYQFPVNGTPGSYYFTSTTTNDSTGNTSIFSNDVDITTGINEMKPGSFQIFPNPTASKFSIQCSERISQITITNLTGEIVFKKNFSVPSLWAWQLDLSNHPKGIYLVHAVTDKKVYNEKIIVE